MRNMIVGAALAMLLVAGLFALAHYTPPTVGMEEPVAAATEVEPGFVGVKRIGLWLLVCRPGPKTAAAIPLNMKPYGAKKDAGDTTLGRCQASLIYRRKQNPKQTVLVLTFRTQGPAQRLVAILVVPPFVKKGDELDLRAGKKILRLPVSTCRQNECAAAVVLAPKGEADLLGAQGAALYFPPGKDGKRSGVPVPFLGLRPAINAMRRAET